MTEQPRLTTDQTALSYWFPKLAAAGLPVPRTELVPMPVLAQQCVWASFDGNDGTSEEQNAYANFIEAIKMATTNFGFPCFLRTDHTSAKHSWEDTCFLRSAADVENHVARIIEFSEMCDLMGLPYGAWAVRELLPTRQHGICQNYGNMPVCNEHRFFIVDGNAKCCHPYWPRRALDEGGWTGSDIDYDRLCEYPISLTALAEAAGRAVGGAWSIDIIDTDRGWFITDMAEAHKSFHWEGCPNVSIRD